MSLKNPVGEIIKSKDGIRIMANYRCGKRHDNEIAI